jgi:hypothetical protein
MMIRATGGARHSTPLLLITGDWPEEQGCSSIMNQARADQVGEPLQHGNSNANHS